jgi:hypothetical protein
VGDQYIHPSATSQVSIQSFWFWVGLGFGVKKPPQREREREKEAKLHLLQTPLYSLFKFDTLLSTHNEVFLFWFFFFFGWLQREPKLSFSHSLSLPSSLSFRVSYIVSFHPQNLIVLLLRIQGVCHFSLSLWFTFKFALFSVPLFPSVFLSTSTLKIGSTAEITHLDICGFYLCVY